MKKTEYLTQKKYRLTVSKQRKLPSAFDGYSANLGCIHLKENVLTLFTGYEWDGATWASDEDFMDASMFHDGLCDLMKRGLLPYSLWNASADVMKAVLDEENEMFWARRQWVTAGVKLNGAVKKIQSLI